MFKLPTLFLMLAPIAFTQSFRIGVEGGVPLSSAFHTHTTNVVPVGIPTGPFNYSAPTKRYTLGATAELGLPFHLAVKADVLYKRLYFTGASSPPEGTIGNTHANSFEFPLLVKYGVSKLGPLQPYVEGGVAFRALQGVDQTSRVNCATCTALPVQTSHPAELSHSFTKGFAAGAGLEFRAPLVSVFGELRYTRWTADAFAAPNGGLNSTRNQADLLVGVTF